MSILFELGPYFFHRKMENTLPMKGEMDGKVYISRQSRRLSFVSNMNKVIFLVCTLTWRVNIYASRQGNGLNRRNEGTDFIVFVLLKTYFIICISVNCR